MEYLGELGTLERDTRQSSAAEQAAASQEKVESEEAISAGFCGAGTSVSVLLCTPGCPLMPLKPGLFM